ncbi:hypothetical protein SprV_0100300400 [Sparganum proliferum]
MARDRGLYKWPSKSFGGDHLIFFRLNKVEYDIYASTCLDFSCMLWRFLTKSSSGYCQRSSSVNGSSFVRIRPFRDA